MDLSLSQYADDTTKQIVAEPGEDVQPLAKRVRCSNDVFHRALAADGFSQNRGKEELLMHLVGLAPWQIDGWCERGMCRCQARSSQWRGISAVTWEERHLSLTSFPGGVKPQWRLFTQSVSCGMRAKAQYQALTSLVTCLAGAAARGEEHGRVRTLTNKEVLRFWKLAPCDVEARVRRLKWAQTMVQDPSHHAQVLTAMFGKLPAQPSSTLGPNGEVNSRSKSVGSALDGGPGSTAAV